MGGGGGVRSTLKKTANNKCLLLAPKIVFSFYLFVTVKLPHVWNTEIYKSDNSISGVPIKASEMRNNKIMISYHDIHQFYGW